MNVWVYSDRYCIRFHLSRQMAVFSVRGMAGQHTPLVQQYCSKIEKENKKKNGFVAQKLAFTEICLFFFIVSFLRNNFGLTFPAFLLHRFFVTENFFLLHRFFVHTMWTEMSFVFLFFLSFSLRVPCFHFRSATSHIRFVPAGTCVWLLGFV